MSSLGFVESLKESAKISADVPELVGAALPKVPAKMIEQFALESIKHKHRHWVARGQGGYFKLAPAVSPGQRHLRIEGELLQTLDHRHIVKGALLSQDGWEILRVNLVDGEPLMNIRDRLTTAAKLKIIEEITDAVRYVNDQGFLHADVCAPNILWTGSRSYLIDFEEAIRVVAPKSPKSSPDFVGGPPCCWGDVGYGYSTYLCVDSLRTWLLTPEFMDVKSELVKAGVWNPHSPGNTCDPSSTPDNGSVYQTVQFGNEKVPGQRDPDLRFRRLSTSKRFAFGGKRVLDIGCNFGRLGAFLERFDIAGYVGLDLDKNYIAVAEKLAGLEGRANAHFLVGDICRGDTIEALNNLSPQRFDVVICQSVYHHIPDKKLFWERIGSLGNRWLIFEGPIDEAKYLLMNSWQEEKQFLAQLGYREIWESDDNDYRDRIFGVFERVG